MEIAISSDVPNYAGGLGVLSADILRSCADMKVNAVGVSIIYHQDDDPAKTFHPEKFMKRLPEAVEVKIEDRMVKVGVFQYDIVGQTGHKVPLFFLTTNLPENAVWDRDLTKNLYPADPYTRVGQEAIFGLGGVKMLKELEYDRVKNYHLNEGHAAFLTLECLIANHYKDEIVKQHCTFTTHTPVSAGHDYFDYGLIHRMLGGMVPWHIKKIATKDALSMTHLSLNLSHKSNSVSARHQKVCQKMFPSHTFENITNGIHHITWTSKPFEKLFEKHLPDWKLNPKSLINASRILDKELLSAHKKNKKELVKWVNSHPEFFSYGDNFYKDDFFDENLLTISFARRFVSYKRPMLIFHDLDRLRDMGYKKLQLIFSGPCHPSDPFGNSIKEAIQKISRQLRGQIKIAVIPGYNLDIAKKLISGSDIWLNNPIAYMEASGTSGMKAALNGVLNCSVLDGWWSEGFAQNPKSGWGIEGELDEHYRDGKDANAIYECLKDILDCYENRPDEWVERMKTAVSLLGYFNTNRGVEEYLEKMWNERKTDEKL